MGILSQKTAIESLIIDQMKTIDPELVIIGENADSMIPDRGNWVRLSFTFADEDFPCIGNDEVIEYESILNIQLFTEIGIGTGSASRSLDHIRDILRRANIKGLTVLNFDLATGVIEADWFVTLLRCFYRFRENN